MRSCQTVGFHFTSSFRTFGGADFIFLFPWNAFRSFCGVASILVILVQRHTTAVIRNSHSNDDRKMISASKFPILDLCVRIVRILGRASLDGRHTRRHQFNSIYYLSRWITRQQFRCQNRLSDKQNLDQILKYVNQTNFAGCWLF